MKTALYVAAAGLGLAVVYRLYQAQRYNVGFARALQSPFTPIGALVVPGQKPGVGTLLEVAARPQARSGRGHF